MKKFFSKLPLICLIAVICGMLTGCDLFGGKNGKFSVSVKEVGSSYVDLEFTGPEATEVAYILSKKEQLMNNPSVIFNDGVEMTVKGGEVVRITGGIDQDTQYYLYLVAKLDAQTYSEVYTLAFKTTEFNFDQLLTVIDTDYDGYRMRITVPESTKKAKNAIRYNQSCIMMYNYMSSSTDYQALLYNGGGPNGHVSKDKTLVYNEEANWYQTEEDSDGDGEIDWDNRFNPISPGEPVVFVAGEFAWMEDSPEYESGYFTYPSGWDPGYYIPLIDPAYFTGGGKSQSSIGIIDDVDLSRPMDAYWTGAFQRKFFRVREPELLDGGVDVRLASASPVNLTFEFYPDDNVKQYAIGIFDQSMYDQILDLLGGREDFFQWAITSYFGAYTFGTIVVSGDIQLDLTSIYYQDAIAEDTEYHVLVTAMGDNMATSQNYQKYTFKTTKKEKDAPVIEVTPVAAETTPYEATFNIKCTTAAEGNPVTECYYAANYLRDWLLAVNAGSTYFSIVAGNKAYSYFSEDELELINSEKGLEISIPSLDGETTRIAVLGYNDEYTPNNLTGFEFIEDCPGVADCTTPYVDPKPYVDTKHYIDLAGDWTATATLENADGSKTFEHSSKITLAADLYDYPATLSKEVYDLYKNTGKNGKDKEEVDAMWYEFKEMAKVVTEERLENQNRLVGIGWLDADSYDRLDARTPYDLFIAKDYSSVDVSSLYNDFGPKWYLETKVNEDGTVEYFIPIDANFLPPAANWSVPFYLGAMDKNTYLTITYGNGWTPSFPVTVNSDRTQIIIHPLVYNGTNYYPNMIGVDSSMQQTLLENPVVSEIVLTKGWNGERKEQSSVLSAGSVQPKGDFPTTVYKPRTSVKASAELQKIEAAVVTVDQFKANADRLIENMYKLNN
ncbi:MAG: hypothetical protein IKY95_02890 [Bacteroidales bacterium]|nr:hypothetical protein [Bacteroidales bacterium]